MSKVVLTFEKPHSCKQCPVFDSHTIWCNKSNRLTDSESVPPWCPLELQDKFIISDFSKSEIDKFLLECNFTEREIVVFEMRNKERTYEEISRIMNVSLSTAKKIGKKVNNKILKVIPT